MSENTTTTALKHTALHDTHKQLGAKMVPFGGYDMPVWYTSVLEEHNAVRTAAGLFDVTHMGVWDAQGPNAALFLDALTTNDVFDIKVGGSQYGYLLDEAGHTLDDIMIYRVEAERYLIVVNASNNDDDWTWTQTQAHSPTLKLPFYTLRDLRAESSGADRLVDVALQGPASLPVLLKLMENDGGRVGSEAATGDGILTVSRQPSSVALSVLPRTGIMRATLAGFDTFISRTGYTGESVGYEIFVHPDHCVALWNALLDAGEPLGVKACGLAARDSLRIEAGLPLYGHELAGPLDLAPFHIGFSGYVKAYKPWFIGKRAYFERAAKAAQRLSRFRLNKKGVRPPKQGTPVVDASGNPIGIVTSCAQDREGFLLGLAMLDLRVAAKESTPIFFQSRAGAPLDEATVQTRFPRRK